MSTTSRLTTTVDGLPERPGLSIDWYVGAQRRRAIGLGAGVVLVSVVMAALVWLLQFVSLAVLLTWLVVLAVAWQPRNGLYVLFGLVALLEDGSQDPLMLPGSYLYGDLSQSIGLNGVITSPIELLLVMTCLVWLARGLASRRARLQGGALAKPMAAFAGALLFGFVRGVAQGGPLNVALWESRFIFYAVMCYFLAVNTIRTRRHVAILTGIFIVSNTVFALEGAYRRVALIDTKIITVPNEFWYNHEDVVFLGCLILFSLALLVYDAPRWQRWMAPFAIVIASYTLMASERRAGFIAVIVAFLTLALVLLVAHRRAFFGLAVPLALAFAVYLPVFWNASGPVAQPARAVRSLKDPDPRDAMSNLTRDLEKINIISTIKSNPLFGVGFGRKFDQVVAIPDISFFVFWDLEPHHGVLWIWLKTGPLGFALFLTLVGGAIAHAGYCVRVIKDPLLQVTAILALCAVVTTLTFSYVDLGLTSGRVTIFFGTMIGVVAVLQRIYQQHQQARTRPAMPPQPALSLSRSKGL